MRSHFEKQNFAINTFLNCFRVRNGVDDTGGKTKYFE